MKFRLLFLSLLISQIGLAQNEKLDKFKVAHINHVIELFKQRNIENLSNIVEFPLQREYPIPSIKNEKEFKQRFSEVFDNTLIEKIVNSKIKQWDEVGYRGIMLDNGIIWIESSNGKIIAVNYQSDLEKKLKKDLIAKEKERVHSSIKNFESPLYKIKTKKYLIRIDQLTNSKYRYTSWKIGEKESSKPDLILNNGQWEFEGSGGNSVITFSNKNYSYKVYRNIIGEDNAADITLEVEKGGRIILTEDGTLME